VSAPDLSGYVEVKDRVVEFYAKYADGRIQATPPEVVTVGDRTFLAVTATVYRTPDDPTPCVASAWEPFPGKTPYTRDSEAMNAETSAWGRALAAAGIGTQRSMSSADEVRARQAERDAEPPTDSPTPQMTKKVSVLFRERGIETASDKHDYMSGVMGREVASWKTLTKAEGSKVIKALEATPAQTLDYKHQRDYTHGSTMKFADPNDAHAPEDPDA
jgi:hypothetical protein